MIESCLLLNYNKIYKIKMTYLYDPKYFDVSEKLIYVYPNVIFSNDQDFKIKNDFKNIIIKNLAISSFIKLTRLMESYTERGDAYVRYVFAFSNQISQEDINIFNLMYLS